MEQFNPSQSFWAFVQNGKIINYSGQHLGYTIEEYNKVLKLAKDYEQVLYDKGILTKPKSTEEINAEMQATLKQAQDMIKELTAKLEAKNGQEHSNGSSEQIHEAGERTKTQQSV